jgi:hypothetical protein
MISLYKSSSKLHLLQVFAVTQAIKYPVTHVGTACIKQLLYADALLQDFSDCGAPKTNHSILFSLHCPCCRWCSNTPPLAAVPASSSKRGVALLQAQPFIGKQLPRPACQAVPRNLLPPEERCLQVSDALPAADHPQLTPHRSPHTVGYHSNWW